LWITYIIFFSTGPVDETQNALPDILCVLQVCPLCQILPSSEGTPETGLRLCAD